MEKKKRVTIELFGYVVLSAFIMVALASSSSQKTLDNWNGSYGQQTVQHFQQSQQGGKYIGNFSSQQEAKAAAERAGYPGYQYYPSTGECFGYK